MAVPEPSEWLDRELYSRQLPVLGLPAMQRIQEARVLLSGLQGLGAEVAKNLVLMGVGSLTLHDPHPTCWSDLASQFFLSETDLGKSRAEASQKRLAQLNEAVRVSVHTSGITEDLLLKFQVVVLTASKLEEQLTVGGLCHKHGICFLVTDTRGLVGQLFCDFGEEFTVQDPTEVEPLTAGIQHITQGFPGILTLRGRDKEHSFCDGDLVTFSGIEGMVELNGCFPRPIRVQKDRSLEIGDTSAFSPYLHGGVVTEVKRPATVRHKPLDRALLQPCVVAPSAWEVRRARCLHQAFRALHEFQHLHGRPLRPWDPVDAEIMVTLARDLGPLKGAEEEPLDEALLWKVALSSAGILSPMAAILGAVAAQEVLKAISRKFMPLDQWLYFDALDCLPEDEEFLPNPEDCAPKECRYDGQMAVFGAGFQETLSHQRYLLVGAGAIGCELLKGFALVGLGAAASGGVTVVDLDHVERSNLSRQFLFRPQDVGKPKAEVAAAATRDLNPDLQVTAHTQVLAHTTENIYGDEFFSCVDGVVAAVDSFEARHYLAARCTHYLKPLLEAGTQGTQGSASVFVPGVTEVYKGPASAEASEDAPTLVCTVRNFPSTSEHTLQWAWNEFEGLFRLPAETINRYQQASTSPADVGEPPMLTSLHLVRGVLRARPRTWQDCVVWALGHWQLRFCDDIVQLLRRFPPDKVQEDGTLFWSGPKQCPQALEFDISQDMHLLYILAAANLYAQMHELPGSSDKIALRALLKSLLQTDSPPLASPSARELAESGRTQETDQGHPAPTPLTGPELQEFLEVWSKGPALKPLVFEKDEDSSFRKDFVRAAASLRAQNYGISEPVDFAQSKRRVSPIIPAIATTTAAVAGLLGLELYKVVGASRAFRHTYLDLAENRLERSAPSPPAIREFHDLKWTGWDPLKVPAGQPERTLESLLAHLQEKYGLKVKMLLFGGALLYSAKDSPKNQAQYLPLRVTERVQQVTGWAPGSGQRVLVLELSCEGEEEDTAFPPLHYELC
ncbi:PREDICTED: ubiquitin-like modifier-activating enzyme 7 isoform X2 [Chinchilla lanigera]|uniref:Ubiquitin like modifier activating enzyme 7 n=1 Tax=Chinchilla lanigera TaxID=34839 RepID=A0A8C2YN30_CHILA|nr:PREDICTED: ubiquitin-like modifier-activating enzyme 7 isoform X2 [Chinchilla lanigera]